MLDRKEYIEKLNTSLNVINDKVSIIESEIQNSVGDAKFWLNNKLIDIKYNKLLLEKKYNQLKKSTTSIKEETKTNIEEIEQRLKKTFDSIKKEITE
jgi:hypothetical protein